VLRIEMTIEDGAQMKICVNYPTWSDLVDCFDVTDPIYTLKLDAEAIANIEADKLILQGKNATVNKVCVVRSTTDGISHVAAQSEKQARVYNLNGQLLNPDTAKGLYIVNGKKVLVK
jgi:hypothetical protein